MIDAVEVGSPLCGMSSRPLPPGSSLFAIKGTTAAEVCEGRVAPPQVPAKHLPVGSGEPIFFLAPSIEGDTIVIFFSRGPGRFLQHLAAKRAIPSQSNTLPLLLCHLEFSRPPVAAAAP